MAGKFDGTLRLDPTQSPDGKSDTEGQFRPVTFKSKVTGSFEKITSAKSKSGRRMLPTRARSCRARQVSCSTSRSKPPLIFQRPRVDFDALAGAGARRLLRDGGGLSLVNGLLAALPEAVDLRSSIKFAALKTGGEVLDNVLLDVSANRGAMRIHELSASLPGRSRSHFEGVFFPGTQYAELAGTLEVKSPDARQLSLWLWPDSKSEIARTWTGLRGSLEGQGGCEAHGLEA